MQTIIINDCWDDNARIRQTIRVSALLKSHVSFVGVSRDIEAAGNLIDAIDALNGEEGVILVNVAPRGNARFENGSPFGYFKHQKAIVIASIDGLTLSLVKKLGLTDHINVFPPESIFRQLGIEEKRGTQFRSYELLPKIAQALLWGTSLNTETLSIEEVPSPRSVAWLVDNFGNVKTTMLHLDDERGILLDVGAQCAIPYFPSLKDVPNGEAGIISGSSGLGGNRFLELVVQGGSAATEFKLKVGSFLKMKALD